MKNANQSNVQRLLTFVLIAVMLIATVGFAVNGWQEPEKENSPEDTNQPSDSTGEDEKPDDLQPDDLTPPDEELTPPEPEPPKFYSAYTGLEISEGEQAKTPIGFVVNPSMPLYGVANSDITVEFPIEDGSTRLLTYSTNDALLWKVGSLAPTRAFITGMSNFFGGIVISYGNDDIVKYSAWDAEKINLNLSKYSDCYYIENTLYVYTSKDMITDAQARDVALPNQNAKVPFSFAEINEKIVGTTEAKSVILPYTQDKKTEFQYSEGTNEYLYFKDGSRKVDMLNGKNISFTNLFILFANSTTYEKSEGTELVIDTTSGGKGYYVSMGTKIEIKWSVSNDGSLEFKTLNGETLVINRGTSYIGYYKASQSTNVLFY